MTHFWTPTVKNSPLVSQVFMPKAFPTISQFTKGRLSHLYHESKAYSQSKWLLGFYNGNRNTSGNWSARLGRNEWVSVSMHQKDKEKGILLIHCVCIIFYPSALRFSGFQLGPAIMKRHTWLIYWANEGLMASLSGTLPIRKSTPWKFSNLKNK